MTAAAARACPVCGGSPGALFDNRMAPLGALDMSYTVCECTGCGFIYAGHLPAAAQYGDYYARFSKYDTGAGVSAVDEARGRAALQVLEARLPQSATVVDIGCGSGALLSLLRQAGFHDLHGVDPAPNAAQRAREAFGLEGVRRGTMADCHAHVPLATADAVLVMAVLEHLWDPARDIAGLLGHLRPGCRVVVEVPALETFDAARGEPYGELSLEHIQFFSLASLDAFMASLGAHRLEHVFAALPGIHAQSLIAMYEAHGQAERPVGSRRDAELMRDYLRVSEARLQAAMAKVPPGPGIVYGAGSHTARLLPALARRGGFETRLLVDANPNLQGTTMGGHAIEPAQAIARHPDLPVIVSSYRFQAPIAQRLSQDFPNPVVTLY